MDTHTRTIQLTGKIAMYRLKLEKTEHLVKGCSCKMGCKDASMWMQEKGKCAWTIMQMPQLRKHSHNK